MPINISMRKIIAFLFVVAVASCKKDEPVVPVQTSLKARIYVANENSSNVQVVNVNDPQENFSIDLDDHTFDMLMPHNVQVAPDGKSVWVTIHPMNAGALDQVAVIDPVSNIVKARVYVGEHYHLAHVVLSDDCHYAFVTATDSDRVVMIDALNYSVIKSFMLPSGYAPHGMRYKNGKLYVACMDGKSLTVIDVASGTINDISLGGVAIQTAATKDGRYVFVSLYDTKELARYDITSGQLVKMALPSTSKGPIQLYCTPDSKTVLVCDQGKLNGMPVSNLVYEIDVASLSVNRTYTVGNASHGIVISQDGKKAFVTGSDDNTVSVIDLQHHVVTQTITVGNDPNGISYWYEGGGMP